MEITKRAARICCSSAVRTRLELATSGVTGRHSNQTELPHQVRDVSVIAVAKIRSFLKPANISKEYFAFMTKKLYFCNPSEIINKTNNKPIL